MQKQQTVKQQYTAPKLIDQGEAVKATKGLAGRCWELIGSNHGDIIRDDP